MKKVAFITGISGQDGSYLAEFLLDQGYDVHGLIRRKSANEVPRNLAQIENKITLHYGDIIDAENLRNLLLSIEPDEIYNLAAQSHVAISFNLPTYTVETNGVGVLKLLEVCKSLHEKKPLKIYQASTSEMFGFVQEVPQTEKTPFYPRSPYAAAKLFAYWTSVNYRESYNMFICNGILFNHESPRRGDNFVTKKITKGFHNLVNQKLDVLELGNINSLRDWGHARDFVRGMWSMMQYNSPDDYVLATGKQYSVKDFCNLVAEWHGIELKWVGKDLDEKAYDSKTDRLLIQINPEFYRPTDVINLVGDSTKAKTVLGWEPTLNLQNLVDEMCSLEQ